MTRRIIEHNQVSYEIAPEEAVPVANRYQAIVVGRLSDEITNDAPAGQARLTNIVPSLQPKSSLNGLLGLSGIPTLKFPQLSLQDYPVAFDLEVPGYLPLSIEAEMGSQAGFPASFDCLELPEDDLVLHREPVVISGRVMESDGLIIEPVSGAEVTIIGVWRLQSELLDTVASENMTMINVLPPLYFGHLDGSATVESGDIARTVHDKLLTALALKDTTQIELSDRNHIGTGHKIAIHDVDPARTEFRTIESPVPDPTRGAGPVELTIPLEFDHPIDSRVEVLPPVLLVDAYAGNEELYLSERINIGAGDTIVIDGDDEYRAEYITISSPPATADQGPGIVTLGHPLAYNHKINAQVRLVNKVLTGITADIARDAAKGDSSLFLDTPLAPTTIRFVEITPTVGTAEIHAIKHYSTTTNAEGYFRLPPIHRVAQVQIEVVEGARTDAKELTLDYSIHENRIDFKLEIP